MVVVAFVIVPFVAFKLFVFTVVAPRTCPVRLVTVVEANVELEVVYIFPPVKVPDTLRLVEVEFVIVALVVVKDVPLNPGAVRLPLM